MEAKARQIPKMEALKDKGILKKEWTSPILSSPFGRGQLHRASSFLSLVFSE